MINDAAEQTTDAETTKNLKETQTQKEITEKQDKSSGHQIYDHENLKETEDKNKANESKQGQAKGERKERGVNEKSKKPLKHTVKNREEDEVLVPFPECIVPREGWGAETPVGEILPLEHPVANVVFTYKTGVARCESDEDCVKTLKELQKRHVDAGMSDIAFNFLIGGNGKVYEGRGWFAQPDPSHQFPELQGKRLDVGFIGDFDAPNDLPWTMAGFGIDLAHYGVGQKYLLKKYRLIETQMHLVFDEYVPNKKVTRPELKLWIEEYYPKEGDEDIETGNDDDLDNCDD